MWGATMFDPLAWRIALKRLRYEGRYTPPPLQGTLVSPGNFGVFNWDSIAVDPPRQIAFTTPTYLAFVSRLVPRQDNTTLCVQEENRPPESLPALNENFGAPLPCSSIPLPPPLASPASSRPGAMSRGGPHDRRDPLAAQERHHARCHPCPPALPDGGPNLGGPIMTAGGVAFLSGTIDDYIRAYDVTNGRELWKSRLPAGGQATPMTYLGKDGRQYVLVVAGGHGSPGAKAGDSVIAYTLPRSSGPAAPGTGGSPCGARKRRCRLCRHDHGAST
jgi:quinoprotein glucose dehydrogenase